MVEISQLLQVRGGIDATTPRIAHAMRNELVEELVVKGEAKVLQHRTGSSSETVKATRGRANQAAERRK